MENIAEERVKNAIQAQMARAPQIHIGVKTNTAKPAHEEVPCKLVGAYRHIFQVEIPEHGLPQLHTFRYTDVVCGYVTIRELIM